MSRALSATSLPARACRSSAGVTLRASGPSTDSSGSSSDPAEQARVVHHQSPAVVEADREPVPGRLVALARVHEMLHAGLPVERAAGRSSRNAAPRRAALADGRHVEDEQLAVAPGARETLALSAATRWRGDAGPRAKRRSPTHRRGRPVDRSAPSANRR